jgi:hypothetical protein
MDRYIGIDAHLKSCTFAILGPSGSRIRLQVVETNGQTLREAVASVAGKKQICLEEGELSGWLCEVLAPVAVEIVVVQAQQRRGPKSDARDAQELAERLRRGELEKVVYKASGCFAGLREAVRAHQITKQDLVPGSRTEQRAGTGGVSPLKRGASGYNPTAFVTALVTTLGVCRARCYASSR